MIGHKQESSHRFRSCRTAPDVPATSAGDALPSRTAEKEPGGNVFFLGANEIREIMSLA